MRHFARLYRLLGPAPEVYLEEISVLNARRRTGIKVFSIRPKRAFSAEQREQNDEANDQRE